MTIGTYRHLFILMAAGFQGSVYLSRKSRYRVSLQLFNGVNNSVHISQLCPYESIFLLILQR